MKKLLVSTSILAALSLTGCGGDSIEDIKAETTVVSPTSRILFDPANGDLNVPNDLLMLPRDGDTFDFTLNIPVADPSDFSDPQNALNVLDGWSTNYPFQINVIVPGEATLDASTLTAGIKIYEATLGLDQADPDCAALTIPSAGCKVGRELTYGVDYILQLSDRDTITVVPLKPLAAAKGHMLVMTTGLKDSSGKSVQGSTAWELVKQDIATKPLSSDSQLQLQTLVNTYIDALSTVGFTREELTYVAAFTTQSIGEVLTTVKKLQVSEFAQRSAAGDPTAGQALPAIVVSKQASQGNAMEKLGVINATVVAGAVAKGSAAAPESLVPAIAAADFSSFASCSGLLAGASGQFTAATTQNFGSPEANAGIDAFAQSVSSGILAQAGPLCAASLYEASVSLPYYLAIPRAENPRAPVNEFWQAACDSGIVLAGADAAVIASAVPGPNAALCQSVGLNDLRVNGEMLDQARNLTKFNPIPQMKGGNQGKETYDVQITLPNPVVAAALGFNIEMPEAGWPVVMLVHGITSKKEDMLAISGALSLAGFATVAIDQPIHGSRGFDLIPSAAGEEAADEINATFVSATHYLNLASLPTARDNSRQAVADLLGIRLGLNAVVDATDTGMVNVNGADVSIMGVSLGGITGGIFASLANTPFEGSLAPLSAMYAVQAASLESPGGGIASFLLESPRFSPLVKGFLLSSASADFQSFLVATYGSVDVTEAQLAAATTGFLNALTPEQAATVNATFGQFAFAAQTAIDSSDPISYFTALGQNTPVHMMTVVGDGATKLPDQVIPVTTALPLSGQLALAQLLGLQEVSKSIQSTEPVSGIVKFISGGHASSLSQASDPAVTVEMQTEVATYMASKARMIQITDHSVVQ